MYLKDGSEFCEKRLQDVKRREGNPIKDWPEEPYTHWAPFQGEKFINKEIV
jgi:hypothetical protein